MHFTHVISKGSRFNQIYIPLEWKDAFEPGDEVEVKLVKKAAQIYAAKNVLKLTPFKEKIAHGAFSILGRYSQVRQAFIFGSFLTKLVDFRDVDVLAVVDDGDDAPAKLEKKMKEGLQRLINLKFHLMLVPAGRFEELRKTCPLTRNMLLSCISNMPLQQLPPAKIDKNHLNYLLMMPEDILEIRVNSRTFYDNIRRLIVIENFLKHDEMPSDRVQEMMERMLPKPLIGMIEENEALDDRLLKKVRALILEKITAVRKLI